MKSHDLQDIWQQLPRSDASGYVYSISSLHTCWQELRAAIPSGAGIYYSLKANPHPTIVEHLKRWGANMDVCSLGELRIALDAGVDPSAISYLGPGKTDEELIACVRHGVGIVVVESLRELSRLSRIATEYQQRIDAVIRVNLRVATEGSRLAMGGKPRQFGIDEDQLLALPSTAIQVPAVQVVGFHSYSGTRNLNAISIVQATEQTLAAFETLADHFGLQLREANVGGGFGVPYHHNESPLDLVVLKSGLERVISKFRNRHEETNLHFESGRYIVAPSAVFVTRVVDKKISKGKIFLICSGGTNHFFGASGGGSPIRRNFPAAALGPDGGILAGHTETVDVAGPLCTPNDILLKDADLNTAEVGDYVTIEMAGAYGPSASPTNFLSHQPPYEVFPDKE